jgi:hypothetical protein
MNHEQIVKRFAERRINSRTKNVSWIGSSMFCEGKILYSYGYHFPVTVYVGNGDPSVLPMPKSPLDISFIHNSDKYSCSTSRHQGMASQVCPGPSISRNALKELNIPFENLKATNILLWREGFCSFVYRNRTTGAMYEDLTYIGTVEGKESFLDPNCKKSSSKEWKPPVFGTYRAAKRTVTVGNSEYETGWYTVNQVVVIEWKKKYYLCQGNKITKLAKKPKTIAEAVWKEAEQKTTDLFANFGNKALKALS